jgi:hypothetical protein
MVGLHAKVALDARQHHLVDLRGGRIPRRVGAPV